MSQCLGVPVLRPLLNVRKQQLFELATLLPLAYMADSTPKWSRRGWIRRLLDGGALEKDIFLKMLQDIGSSSENFGDLLDSVVVSWKSKCVFPHQLTSAGTLPVLVLDLNPILDSALLQRLDDVIQETKQIAGTIAEVWNPVVAIAAQNHFDSCTADEDDMPSSCPLNEISKKITEIGLKSDAAGGMLICRAFYSLHDDVRAQTVFGNRSLSRKGLLHLWEMLRTRGGRAAFLRGSLHQHVHYTLSPKTNIVALHRPCGETVVQSALQDLVTNVDFSTI